MNDKTLRLFRTVAECGSFSRAEALSFISKQAIVKQMDALEAELGVELFTRSSRGVRLTEAGEILYRGAEKLLDLQEEILADCRRSSREADTLRIGNVEHQALLSEVTEAYALKYPDVRVIRVIHPNHSGEYRVEHGIMDVAETFYSPVVAKMPLGYTRLIDLPYKAAVGKLHPLAGCRQVSLTELRDYRTVVFRPMTAQPILEALQTAFRGREENLELRTDVDNQVPVAFACAEEGSVLLSASAAGGGLDTGVWHFVSQSGFTAGEKICRSGRVDLSGEEALSAETYRAEHPHAGGTRARKNRDCISWPAAL